MTETASLIDKILKPASYKLFPGKANFGAAKIPFWEAKADLKSDVAHVSVRIDLNDGDDNRPIFADLNRNESGSFTRQFRFNSPPKNVEFFIQPASASGHETEYSFTQLTKTEVAILFVSKAIKLIKQPTAWWGKFKNFIDARMPISFSAPKSKQETLGEQTQRLLSVFDDSNERKRVQHILGETFKQLPKLHIGLVQIDNDQLPNIRVGLAVCDESDFSLKLVPSLGEVSPQKNAEIKSLREVVVLLEKHNPDVIVFTDGAGNFSPLGAGLLLAALQEDQIAIATGDYAIAAENGELRWIALPKFSRELLQNSNYLNGSLAIIFDKKSKSLLSSLAVESVSISDIARALASFYPDSAFKHISRVIFRCAKAPIISRLASSAAMKNPLDQCDFSIIIPTKDRMDTLPALTQDLLPLLTEKRELIIVDNGSRNSSFRDYLTKISSHPFVKILRSESEFNFSQLCNLGRKAAQQKTLIFLNDDISFTDPKVFDTLANQASRAEIGCVGAWLLYPTGEVQHAGVIIGVSGFCQHEFAGLRPTDPTVTDPRFRYSHEVAAVTGACVAMRAELFDAINGFNLAYAVTLNDIDLCLRVRKLGYRNLVLRDAVLVHHESLSRGIDKSREQMLRLNKEISLFTHEWRDALLAGDPYRSPLLGDNTHLFK